MSKVKTSIVDRNGKATHVWKNPDVPGGNKSFDRLGNVSTQYVPIANAESTSSFNGVVLTGTDVHLSSKDGRNIAMSIPEVGALLNSLHEYPAEWGSPNHDTVQPITNDLRAGWRGKEFIIEDKHSGEISLDNNEVYLLASNLDLYMNTARDIDGYTQTHGFVDIVRTPVGDRDENYYVTLGKDAMLTTYIQDSGLSDGDLGGNDRDQVTFYRDAERPNDVKIQISYNDDIDISDHLDSLDDDEEESYKKDINDALAAVDPRISANFDSPEQVELLFTDVSTAVNGEADDQGKLEFTTSNVLHPYSESEHVSMMDQAWGVFRSKVDY